ncbi:unnamed protein product [Amoebophrya sp. A25]|nr:unnamed protein product [Amoebophrya sp. A25]|eukprot:GSA25T00005681001.1
MPRKQGRPQGGSWREKSAPKEKQSTQQPKGRIASAVDHAAASEHAATTSVEAVTEASIKLIPKQKEDVVLGSMVRTATPESPAEDQTSSSSSSSSDHAEKAKKDLQELDVGDEQDKDSVTTIMKSKENNVEPDKLESTTDEQSSKSNSKKGSDGTNSEILPGANSDALPTLPTLPFLRPEDATGSKSTVTSSSSSKISHLTVVSASPRMTARQQEDAKRHDGKGGAGSTTRRRNHDGMTTTSLLSVPREESQLLERGLDGSALEEEPPSPAMSERTDGGLARKLQKQICTSLVASVSAELATYPLETIKLMQQVHGGSALSICRHIVKTKGLRGFFHGTAARMVQTIASNVGFFIWQAVLSNYLLENKESNWVRTLMVNMFSQQVTRIFTSPIEVVANRNQADPNSGGALRVFRKVLSQDGIQGFYKGLGVSLILSLNPALMFTLVDKLTIVLKRLLERDAITAGQMFQVSAVAKMIATVVTYPLIRAKTVMQTTGAAGLGAAASNGSLAAVMRALLQKEGVWGLYQGVWVLSYKTVLFNALMMSFKARAERLYNEVLVQRAVSKLTESGDTVPPAWEVSSPDRNPQEEAPMSQVEALLGEYPWEAAAGGKSVVYCAGAWAFLHPSHQNLLFEARQRGDHVVVGVHDSYTRTTNYARAPEERYEVRVERVRTVKGVHSIVKHAPWKIDEHFMKRMGISKVLAGRRCSADPRDPYYIAERLGKFQFVEDPYDGMWRNMIKVMFSNVDAGNEPPLISSPTHRAHSKARHMPLFRRDSRGELRISGEQKGKLRKGSWYFLYQADQTERPNPNTKRARHLRETEARRDKNWSKESSPKASPGAVSPRFNGLVPVKTEALCEEEVEMALTGADDLSQDDSRPPSRRYVGSLKLDYAPATRQQLSLTSSMARDDSPTRSRNLGHPDSVPSRMSSVVKEMSPKATNS